MTKSIELTREQWLRLNKKLKEEYSLSTVIIRSKMKSVLGFTDRMHHWVQYTQAGDKINSSSHTRIMLDFYSEKKYTWFLMKYSDYLTRQD